MSEQPSGPENTAGSATPEPDEPQAVQMPSWVPLLIGAVLLAIAGLAVYTGLNYRDSILEKKAWVPAKARAGDTPNAGTGAPGEPQAGASRIVQGKTGADTPAASAPLPANASRIAISGGPGGVSSVQRMTARRGVMFRVEPPDAVVYVNELPIGPASQFESDDEVYEFPEEGSFTIRVTAPGFRAAEFVITTDAAAPDSVAVIEANLEAE